MTHSRPWSDVDGVLLLDKETGMSSNAALQQARRLLNARKAGHTGSLDPAASGLLPLCFGEATKLAGYLLDTSKRYRVTVHLGIRTDSGDADGEVIARAPVPPLDPGTLERVLQGFRGPIAQIPPMHSALKHHGTRLYELARRGIAVERAERAIVIYQLILLNFEAEQLELDVACSKGTYIRVLAEDIGAALGCGAHVLHLRRTEVGDLRVDAARTLGDLAAMAPDERLSLLKPADLMVSALPTVRLDREHGDAVRNGQRITLPNALPLGTVRLYDADNSFFGLGEVGSDSVLAPRRLFSRREAHD